MSPEQEKDPAVRTSSLQESSSSERLEQRMVALKRANDIRTARANLKKELRQGEAEIVDLLAAPPDYLHTAKFFDLLVAVPKYGEVKTYRLLNRCRLSPNKTIGSMSQRQRREVISFLEK
jgi:hypothetical protein